MTHTFDSKVSLHSWLLWPTVWRGVFYSSMAREACYAGRGGRAGKLAVRGRYIHIEGAAPKAKA